MPRRRKLSKEYEQQILTSQKDVELILAKINDIDDDDIRVEYTVAFAPIKTRLDKIHSQYKQLGYTDQSDLMYNQYLESIEFFKKEYEI